MAAHVFETYEGLWGELMFVMHDQDHLRFVNKGRADWFESVVVQGQRVLDLGSGNGYFDLELGRRGYEVVAVDRVARIVDAARQMQADEFVEFVASDLREVQFDRGSFDAVTMFGVLGLMSVEDDTALMERCFEWLRPGGSLLADCDTTLAETQTIEAEHEFGVIKWNWTSDAATRTNMLTPELHRKDGAVVGLRDPIDPARGDHVGLHRYIYPEELLTDILASLGYVVENIGHYVQYVFPETTPESYMIKATRIS